MSCTSASSLAEASTGAQDIGMSTEANWATCQTCGGELTVVGGKRRCINCGAVPVVSLRSRMTTWLIVVLLVVGVLAVVGLGVLVEPSASGDVKGSLTISGPPLANLTFRPTECFGAERIVGVRFDGVALLGTPPDTAMVRVVRHLHHPGARVSTDLRRDVVVATRSSPSQPWREMTLTPQNCPGLTLDLERFAPQADHDSLTDRYRGQVSAECSLQGGGRINLAIRFDDCRCNPYLEKRSVE